MHGFDGASLAGHAQSIEHFGSYGPGHGDIACCLEAADAVRAVAAMSVDGLNTEVDYFGSEEAAGRYLAVATKGGELPEDADIQLQRLQREVEKLSPSPPAETPEPAEEIYPDDDSDAVPLEIEAEEGAA